MVFIRPEQVWVSGITYIGNGKNPSYLALIKIIIIKNQ